MLGIQVGGLECPFIPCGYFASIKHNLVSHFARTHKFLHQKVKKVAEENNLVKTSPYLSLENNGFFKEHLQQIQKIFECPYCRHPCSARHLNRHQVIKHFKTSYDQEIRTGQHDFGYEAWKCPGPNCEHNFAVKITLIPSSLSAMQRSTGLLKK